MSVLQRHNVTRTGAGKPLLFAHGYGCDQNVWHPVANALVADHEVVLYDYAGCGAADPSLYDTVRHATLDGHADDLIGMGAEAIIAGCTEAPLVMDPGDVRAAFIDPGELLARRCVAVCLGLEPVPALPAP